MNTVQKNVKRRLASRSGSAVKAGQKDPVMSKREANKLDKLQRIRRAAEELFTTRGFDDSTMRDIAAHADIALGTLFLYASNKRDLLFLIANDAMEDTCTKAARLVSEKESLIDNFMTICALHYRLVGSQPQLFKLVLREQLFYDSGAQAIRANRNRARLLHLIADIVEIAYKRGEIDLPQPPDFIAWVLFGLLQAGIRRWIALETHDLSEGLQQLWAAVALTLNGVSKKDFPDVASSASMRRLLSRAVD
jgi:AcrR family transcriptional regulator